MTKDISGTKILHYRIQERVRQRAASDLYLAKDERAHEIVFIEIVHPHSAPAEINGRFQRRMETVSQLQHDGIAHILEIGTTPNKQAYAVIEYVSGRRLSEVMADPAFQPTPIAALTLVRKIARILQVGHPVGIFHHDLRPKNIMMRNARTPVFIDLGVPITRTSASREAINAMQQLDYSPPEQLDGKPLTSCSNVYSLGVLLYQLLAGRQPPLPRSQWDIFERKQLPKEIPLAEVKPNLTAATYEVVRQCLWRAEWSRYQSLDDLISALDEAIAAEKAGPESKEAGQRPFSRRQLLIAAGVVLIAIIIVAGILLFPGAAG